jgi:hypothetical protein
VERRRILDAAEASGARGIPAPGAAGRRGQLVCAVFSSAVSCLSLSLPVLKLTTLRSSSSTTAGIIKEYIAPPSLIPKKVDFCIVLDPGSSTASADKAMADRIDKRRRTYPLSSINYTDLDALISCPIVVSIETKRDGSSLE